LTEPWHPSGRGPRPLLGTEVELKNWRRRRRTPVQNPIQQLWHQGPVHILFWLLLQ